MDYHQKVNQITHNKLPVYVFSGLAWILLLAASLAGVILDDGGNPHVSMTLRGVTAEIYGGEGLYQFDTVYKAVLFRGFDWANFVVGLPLLIWGVYLYRRGRLKGQLLLAAIFAYLAYNYLIGAMGNAFNILFLVWTALFSVGIFGLALVLAELDMPSFPQKLQARFPGKSLSIYMIVLGLFLLSQYLGEILTAYGSGNPPASLGPYTTLELAALELGIMIPLHLWGAIMLWKQKAIGYLMSILLSFTALMTFISLSVSSILLYFSFEHGNVFDMAIPIILSIIALGFSVAIFKQVKD